MGLQSYSQILLLTEAAPVASIAFLIWMAAHARPRCRWRNCQSCRFQSLWNIQPMKMRPLLLSLTRPPSQRPSEHPQRIIASAQSHAMFWEQSKTGRWPPESALTVRGRVACCTLTLQMRYRLACAAIALDHQLLARWAMLQALQSQAGALEHQSRVKQASQSIPSRQACFCLQACCKAQAAQEQPLPAARLGLWGSGEVQIGAACMQKFPSVHYLQMAWLLKALQPGLHCCLPHIGLRIQQQLHICRLLASLVLITPTIVRPSTSSEPGF